MDVDRYITESASFTVRVLTEKWSRWVIFVLLGLPWTLLTTLLQSRNVFDGTTIHWKLIPWNEAALLIITGTLCNIILWGYIVRLLAGGKNPPEFTNGPRLVLDGIKIHTIPLVWVLIPILLGVIEYTVTGSEFITEGSSWRIPALILLLVLVIIQIVILLFAIKLAIIGTVRFARTGSVREAFAVPAIKDTLDRIGIVNYYIALGVITLLFLIVTFLLNIVALIPFAGRLITLALGPVLTVYCFRFIAHFCDEDTYTVTPGRPSLPLRAIVPEFLAWFVVLVVLTILCFTPLVVISGVIGRVLPF
jgi:hypothetical protein